MACTNSGVPMVLAQRTEAVVALDWTEFDADYHSSRRMRHAHSTKG